ncbi:right-handed parallel beta-helix repeat-containing protein [Labilibacter sediminis]|nr:right-handed parallel beta-helix repeat-containing protein [Labilibacter sediminis]
MKKIFVLSIVLWLGFHLGATKYYVNSESGDDSNNGTHMSAPFASLSKVNTLKLNPGDQILLARGCVFKGTLELQNQAGTKNKPIVVSSYSHNNSAKEKPLIEANGFLNGILIINCSNILIKDIEITAKGGGFKTDVKLKNYMCCGVLVTTSKAGEYKNILLQNLTVRDVFFEKEGFSRGAGEVKTANGKQNYGWGIRFINATEDAVLKDLTVKDCTIKNVAHTGLKFTGKGKSIHNIQVFNNDVIETGGPGIQMSGVHTGHVKGNRVNHSGSNNDSRKWGRGSGLWTWGTSDVIIEHNSFKNANGPGDSAGCHIDYNCNNIIVQYNLSAYNAGGFCEILGNNYNCAYRYNVSVNDGHRVKGKDGAFQEGKIFWLSGYQGNKKRSGPFNSYFYNNTMYVNKGIVAKIAVNNASSGVLIANNIFHIEGDCKAVLGDQYNPQKKGASRVKNIVFKNNLYLNKSNWPKEVLIQDEQPIIGNARFVNAGGSSLQDYLPLNAELIKNKGIEIEMLPGDSIGLINGLKVRRDILDTKIKGLPDMGAIELK